MPGPRNSRSRSHKVAITIPEDLFQDAERAAKRLKMPRSQLYSRLLRSSLSRGRMRKLDQKKIDEINKMCQELDLSAGQFLEQAAHQLSKRTKWNPQGYPR